MVEKHKRDKQGRLMDGVRADAAKTTDREVYDSALSEIGALAVPRMFDSRNPHARLYIANFDGTGNHVRNDPEHATNVARLHLDFLKAQEKDSRIRSDYVEGAGTQDSFISRTLDGAQGCH